MAAPLAPFPPGLVYRAKSPLSRDIWAENLGIRVGFGALGVYLLAVSVVAAVKAFFYAMIQPLKAKGYITRTVELIQSAGISFIGIFSPAFSFHYIQERTQFSHPHHGNALAWAVDFVG